MLCRNHRCNAKMTDLISNTLSAYTTEIYSENYWYEEYNSTDTSLLNNTDIVQYEDHQQFILPWWEQVIFFTAFAAILLVASGGNVTVIWIVLTDKRMRTVTNYFLVNLAIADFMISVLNMMFTVIFLMYQIWWFGRGFCKFSVFISPCAISVSVLTFMAIAIDRYIAIIYPLRPRMRKRHVIGVISLIWVISIALSIPNIIYADTVMNPRTLCKLMWSTDKDLAYSYSLLFLNYVFPLVTLMVTYTRVGIELWGSQAIGEETSVQHDRVRSKRKVVKMMIVVIVIFALCWLPMHLYFLIANHCTIVTEYKYIQQIYLVIFLMAMSNSMYNPIIYCWMNSRFREGFIRVFCWCSCKPFKKTRSQLRFRRTLFLTSANTASDKYRDRMGSVMHTVTEYVDIDVTPALRIPNSQNGMRKALQENMKI